MNNDIIVLHQGIITSLLGTTFTVGSTIYRASFSFRDRVLVVYKSKEWWSGGAFQINVAL